MLIYNRGCLTWSLSVNMLIVQSRYLVSCFSRTMQLVYIKCSISFDLDSYDFSCIRSLPPGSHEWSRSDIRLFGDLLPLWSTSGLDREYDFLCIQLPSGLTSGLDWAYDISCMRHFVYTISSPYVSLVVSIVHTTFRAISFPLVSQVVSIGHTTFRAYDLPPWSRSGTRPFVFCTHQKCCI
jgi:hypothetical protein